MTNWTPLTEELAHWRDDRLTLPLWWRDDDAVEDTEQLRRLANISAKFEMPVHIAIIPARAVRSLVQAVADAGNLIPVVHGWAHANHAPSGQKKCEFPDTRELSDQVRDIRAGKEKLSELFGKPLVPMFVPPWNRITPALFPVLRDAGYRALSTYGSRKAPEAAPGLAQINTHIDPVDWHGGRGLLDPDQQITRLVALLQDRRTGKADNTEPLGLLTHHLAHDQPTWAFIEELISVLRTGPVSVQPGPIVDANWNEEGT